MFLKRLQKYNNLNLNVVKYMMMRVILTCISFLVISCALLGQGQYRMKYQAILFDTTNNIISNDTVGFRLNIVKDSAQGTIVYGELHRIVADADGFIKMEIGGGTAEVGAYDSIDWSTGSYFLQSYVDFNEDSNYVLSNITEFVSVPYALHSRSAGSGITLEYSCTGDTLFITGGNFVIISGLSAANLPTPTYCTGSPTTVVEVTSSTGKIWMDRDLGATQAATSLTDVNAYGDFYQWGRFADGHQCRNSDTSLVLATTPMPNRGNPWDGKFIVLKGSNYSEPYDWLTPQNDDLLNGFFCDLFNPCPSGFRIPTSFEWIDERLTWSTIDPDGAFSSALKIPAGGLRSATDGTVQRVGERGWYWSSTISATRGQSHVIGSTLPYLEQTIRSSGRSVRCIKN